MTFFEIEKKAHDFLGAMSSSTNIKVSTPPIPIEEIAVRFLKFEIIQKSLSPQKISGMIQLNPRRLIVNSKEPIVRRRFSIAHEIGHWFLHAQQREDQVVFRTGKNKDRVEAEANVFAGTILMPSTLIYEYVLKNINIVTGFETEWLLKLLALLSPQHRDIFNKLLFSQFFGVNIGALGKKTEWAKTIVSLIPILAKDFQVSKEAMSIRFQILGLLKPISEIKELSTGGK